MSMDISISSTADLAASSWALPHSPNSAAITEKESFQEAFQSASQSHSALQKDSPEKISGVAKQFEALMIGQMLKSAREANGGGWLSDEDSQEDQTGSMVMEMAEQGFSQAIAARGGLGIANMVTKQIERSEPKTPSSDSTPPLAAPTATHAVTNKH
jgi:flagellar protein FlgJ